MKRSSSIRLMLVVLLAACAGPREPLDVGMREVASDIVLGAQSRPAPAMVAPPIPPAPVVVNLPAPVRLPSPARFAPSAAPSPTSVCPTADPLQTPRFGATDSAGTAPVEEELTFAYDGGFTVSGANANEGSFASASARTVDNVVIDDNGDFTYDVTTVLFGTTSTSSYLMRNERPVDDGLGIGDQAGVDQQRGLFLTRVTSSLVDGTSSSFDPATPMRLLRFPVFAGDTFDEVGTDIADGVTMRWTITAAGPSRVDACGELVSALRVELTEGSVQSVGSSVDFSATYDIATQYGGLIVQDRVVTSGTEGSDTVTRTSMAHVTRVPTHRSEATG